MPLPSSGELTFIQVAGELSATTSDMSLRTFSSTAGKSVPDSLNEFHGYSAVVVPTMGAFSRTSTSYTSMNFSQVISSNGGGTITSYGYQYGTSGYTTTITISNSNPGSSFSFSRSGLSANTNYYVRGWATNSAGTSYSSGGTFRTNAYPASGTYQLSYCSGCTLYYRYHNGSGGTYNVSQGTNNAACGCQLRIASVSCSGDPFLCCSVPGCGNLTNDDYNGLQSAITCDGPPGNWTCTLGAYSSNTGTCTLYWGRGSSWGDASIATTNTNSIGSGRCTGASFTQYMN